MEARGALDVAVRAHWALPSLLTLRCEPHVYMVTTEVAATLHAAQKTRAALAMPPTATASASPPPPPSGAVDGAAAAASEAEAGARSAAAEQLLDSMRAWLKGNHRTLERLQRSLGLAGTEACWPEPILSFGMFAVQVGAPSLLPTRHVWWWPWWSHPGVSSTANWMACHA